MAAYLNGKDPRSVQQAVEEHREMQAIREQAIKDGTFMKAHIAK